MYAWMDHILDPKVNAEEAVWYGEAPANQKSCALMGDLPAVYGGTPDYCKTIHADDDPFWNQIAFWETPLADCGDDRGDVVQDIRRVGPGLDRGQGVIAWHPTP